MFSENLKTIRKAKGYTQEELAMKVNVVRQTVSKWEKGLSVPDADVLSAPQPGLPAGRRPGQQRGGADRQPAEPAPLH